MITPDNLPSILTALAWPFVVLASVLVFMFLFRNEIRELLKRLQKAKLPGGTEASFEDSVTVFSKITSEKQNTEPKPSESPSEDILPTLINNLTDATCWYLLKVANKDIDIGEHINTIIQEAEIYELPFSEIDRPVVAVGYFKSMLDLRGLLFEGHIHEETETMQIEISPKAIELIKQRLQI